MKYNIKHILWAIVLVMILIGVYLPYYYSKKQIIQSPACIPVTDTILSLPVFIDKPAKDGLKEALKYYDILYPEVVYAQAILETGHFKSAGCLRDNNLFGLYNSRVKQYYRFEHWSESVVAYKKWIQKKYKPPEDYYAFLQRIGYAEDPEYVDKLKIIVRNNDKKRSSEGSKINS